MSLTSDFKSNPTTFLNQYVVMVDEHGQADMDNASRQQIYKFVFASAQRNGVTLKFKIGGDDDFVSAYWLPWKESRAPSMQLGADADFFFTSEMTNCRFSVIDPDPKTPRVSHVAGNLTGTGKRNVVEVEDKFRAKDEVKVRRLSVAGSLEKVTKAGSTPGQHKYAGQRSGAESSAFTFGQRGGNGEWKFVAQISKGTLSAGFFNTTLTENIEVLGFVTI